MAKIYEPKGKAREYSPLALNVYSQCDHNCTYCYCAGMQRVFGRDWAGKPSPASLVGLERSAAGASRQVLLSFVGDPYCHAEEKYRNTRKALKILKEAECSVAILTKGGTRCLADIDLFSAWPGGRIKVGATLTFVNEELSLKWEPGADLPDGRLGALKNIHDAGIKTWASIEPVIDPAESLSVIRASLPFVDAYKVGKLNHVTNTTDWESFGITAVETIRSAGKTLYVKNDLRAFLPHGYLTNAECDCETVFLSDRPKCGHEFNPKGEA